MANMFIRTIIMYVVIVVLMRLTGKRQIGQLEITELVTAFMVSELASYPISNNTIPLLYGILPAITLICLEVFLSYASLKSRKFGKLLEGSEMALIKKGELDQKQMNKARITVEELKSALRVGGIASFSMVEYAFLESNGTISIIPKTGEMPLAAKYVKSDVKEEGIDHSVIIDGRIIEKELATIGVTKEKVGAMIAERGYKSIKEIFYMGIDDDGKVYIIEKEKEA